MKTPKSIVFLRHVLEGWLILMMWLGKTWALYTLVTLLAITIVLIGREDV